VVQEGRISNTEEEGVVANLPHFINSIARRDRRLIEGEERRLPLPLLK